MGVCVDGGALFNYPSAFSLSNIHHIHRNNRVSTILRLPAQTECENTMASLTPNISLQNPHTQIILVGATLVLLIGLIFTLILCSSQKEDDETLSIFGSFLRFFYASFLKPHTGDSGNGQQDALESFYKAQASVYDATRRTLLRGREDMLALVAAQLVQKAASERTHDTRRIWVDVGGGT